MYLLAPISPVLCSRWRFHRTFGRPLDLRTPRTLNEKLMWLKLRRYGSDPLVTRCADQVRRPRLRGVLRLRRHPQRAVRRVGPPPGHPMGRPAPRLRAEMQPRLRLQHPLPRQVRAGQGGRRPHTEQVDAPRFLAGLCGAAVPPHPQKDRLRAVSGPRRRPARLQNLLLPRPAPLHSGLRGPQPWQAEILLLRPRLAFPAHHP